MLCHWCLVLPSERERDTHDERESMVLIMAAPISAIIFLMPPFWCCFQFEFCSWKNESFLWFSATSFQREDYFVIWAAADSVGARSCHGNKMMFLYSGEHSTASSKRTVHIKWHGIQFGPRGLLGRITGVTSRNRLDDLNAAAGFVSRNVCRGKDRRADWEQEHAALNETTYTNNAICVWLSREPLNRNLHLEIYISILWRRNLVLRRAFHKLKLWCHKRFIKSSRLEVIAQCFLSRRVHAVVKLFE